jgi:hypothetical protein
MVQDIDCFPIVIIIVQCPKCLVEYIKKCINR